MKLRKQIVAIVLVVALFAAFNLSMYQLLTRRLSNNFSGATQAQMIDVRSYLPHEEGSDLPKINASLKLTDNLPVLDGAAALVPVYAAVIDNIYPEGCVTYEGGEFSDDNYYGENFAEDSAMQYKNTVRGYQAIVDGTTDILFCAGPSAEQKQYAEEKGVELVYVPIGLEGSGSQTTFESFMGDYKIGRKSPLAITGASIGFSFRYYMDGIVENDAVKMLSLNGVYPSAENIQNRSYPIVAQFYAIYRADNDNENIPVLIDWLLSEEGQTLIEETGYVRIN